MVRIPPPLSQNPNKCRFFIYTLKSKIPEKSIESKRNEANKQEKSDSDRKEEFNSEDTQEPEKVEISGHLPLRPHLLREC